MCAKLLKILLIEDNLEMAENIASILELAKYQVTHAVNGMTGVDLAQKNPPDLILCDIMMPELDGYGVLPILNKEPETASRFSAGYEPRCRRLYHQAF